MIGDLHSACFRSTVCKVGQGLKGCTLRLGPPELLFDGDFQGQGEADKKFAELIRQAQQEGFRVPLAIEMLEFQAKAQEQRSQQSF